MNRPIRRAVALALVGLFATALAACGPSTTEFPRQSSGRGGATYDKPASVFGEGGMNFANLFSEGNGPPGEGGGAGGGIGVNSFLWRASLDTIAFMPLSSADPFGGVIITDWYSPPEAQTERFKVNVYILGRDLRADGIRAAVFRQETNGAGGWTDARVEEQTVLDLENAILARARELRIAGLQ